MVSNTQTQRGLMPFRIAVGTILIFLALEGGASALSNDGGSWASNRDITISNPGGMLSDYQVLLNLTGAAFPTGAEADGADVRFTNSDGDELNYWIESWGAGSAKVWVNVTNIPVGASTIRMWWENLGGEFEQWSYDF